MTFTIWGDEIAYDHQVVGMLTISPTTLRERVEEDLYSIDPERIEKENVAWRADLEREHEQELDDKDSEIQGLEETISRLSADLQAIDDGVTVAQLRAELAESQAAVHGWRNRCIEMQEEAKKARKRRVRTIETA